MDDGLISSGNHAERRWGSEHPNVGASGNWTASVITSRRPMKDFFTPDQIGVWPGRQTHEDAIWEVVAAGLKESFRPVSIHTFLLQLTVDLLGTDRDRSAGLPAAASPVGRSPEFFKPHIVGVAALRARPMSGGQCCRLVQEKKFRVLAGRHRRAVPILEDRLANQPPLLPCELPTQRAVLIV